MKAVEQRDLGLCGLGQLQREIDSDARLAPWALQIEITCSATIRRIGRRVAKQLRAQTAGSTSRVSGFGRYSLRPRSISPR